MDLSSGRSARASRDAESARYFAALIGYLGGSARDLARRIGCPQAALEALTHGVAVPAPWPETVRIVTRLAALANIEPQTPLRMAGRCWAPGPGPAPRPAPVRPDSEPESSRWLSWRWPVYACAVAGPIAFLALAERPAAFDFKMGAVVEPVAQAGQKAFRFVFQEATPKQDGLRWIEVADPRSRRGDKLAVKRR